jgi:hypothetical protein
MEGGRFFSIDAAAFKPSRKGEGDFYSWQLYRWLLKYPRLHHVYRSENCVMTGTISAHPQLYIGKYSGGRLCGVQLQKLCTLNAPIRPSITRKPPFIDNSWVDVTSDFFNEYRQKGVCALYGDLWHEWKLSDSEKERTCTRCNTREEKIVKMVPHTSWKKINALRTT